MCSNQYPVLEDTHPVLHRSADGLVILVDLPESLRDSVWTPMRRNMPRPISTEPREEPFNVPESDLPKESDGRIQNLAEGSLALLREDVRMWYLPRVMGLAHPEPDINPALQATLSAMGKFGSSAPVFLTSCQNTLSLADIYNRYVLNPNCEPVALVLEGTQYHIPAKSAFLNGTVPACLSGLKETVSTLTESPYFDFILLDPPWPNRSARRKGDYQEDKSIKKLLQSIPLRQIAAYNALVGIWITNKPKYRQLALDLLKSWGLILEEEWIWVKITANGQPITPLDSSWRSPWETLFLARRYKPGSAPLYSQTVTRIIVAVPDVHSRKPCVKRLIEPYLPVTYQALEIFARHVTAGWWAIGNEPCKFNRDDWWVFDYCDVDTTKAM